MRRNTLIGFALTFLVVMCGSETVWARPLSFQLAGDTLLFLAGNSVVDIEYDTIQGVPTVWVGTGTGASASTDDGVTWRAFTTASGLTANSISALTIARDTVWVGMAHSQDFNGDLFPVGDGFNYSPNMGDSWDTSRPAQSTGIGYFSQQVFGMLPFDLDGEPSGIWAACFFGGLIRSIDGGANWFSVYPSDSSRADFENKAYTDLANRFFSVEGGTVVTDSNTIEVYAGSADGINRFEIIDAKVKVAGAPIWSLHTNPLGNYEWFAANGGISRADVAFPDTTTRSYFDTTTSGILPAGMYLSSAGGFTFLTGEFVAFGAFDTVGTDTVGLGMVRSTDEGQTWSVFTPSHFLGSQAGAYDLAFTHQGLWAAAGDSGLYRSLDNGGSWQQIYVDTLQVTPGADPNRVYSVSYDSIASQIYVGTWNGIYRLTLGGGDAVTAWEAPLYTHPPGDTIGQVARAFDLFHNQTGDLLLWAAMHPDTADTLQRAGSLYSNDLGVSWLTVASDLLPWGYAFLDDTVFAATQGGLMVAPLTGITYTGHTVVQAFELSGTGDTTLFASPYRAIATISDSITIGGDVGWAYRRSSSDWDISRFVPRDSVDRIQASKFVDGSSTSISGNFVIALDLQDNAGARTVWASTRPVTSPQFLGVSRSTDAGQTWWVSLANRITWNLASFNEHVWAATSDGLFHTVNAGSTWTAIPIVDLANNTAFYEGTEILSVSQVDDSTVLAGSEDGLGRSTDLGATWTITRSFVGVETERAGGTDIKTYASPVPFSPVTGTRLRIHYKPNQDGSVSIEVFDFAMQKVATILDGAFRSGLPGADPFGTNHYYEEWDATNDKGQAVATGVYFFRVNMQEGTEWGKLVILP